jgi:hypothetical protein
VSPFVVVVAANADRYEVMHLLIMLWPFALREYMVDVEPESPETLATHKAAEILPAIDSPSHVVRDPGLGLRG